MNIKRAWLVFFGALFVSVPLRIFQLIFFVDYETGFFTDDGVITASLTIFLLLTSALLIFMCLRDKNAPKRYPPIKNIPAGLTAGVAGVVTLIHSVLAIVSFAKPREGMEAAAVSTGQQYLTVILGLVGVIAGAIWVVTAVGYFTQKNFFREMPVFALIPPVWLCINLVALILNYTTYANFTENVYDMLTVMFMLIFVFTRAKLFAGVRLTSSGKRIYAFGFPAILFACITAVPNVVLQIAGKSPISGLTMTFSLVLTGLALYGFVHLWMLPKIPDISLEPEPEQEEKPEGQEEAQAAEEEAKPEPEQAIEPEPKPPRPVPRWEQEEEEPDVEEIVDIPKVPAIYKFKDPPRKKKKKKKKKKVPLLRRMLNAIRKMLNAPKTDEELEEERRITWKPSQLDEPATKKLDQDWFLDYYGFERKDGEAYVPKVYDVEEADQPAPEKESEAAEPGKETPEP
ncbi:MAG: hypothetical protein HFJ84_09655 [Clostridiales bacterium]|nr:hypothetical protein [Clostridiales bacterium]